MDKLYEILVDNYSDYHLGFEVQSPQKAFISWDTTYQELIRSPLVEENNPLDMDFATYDEYRFKYPVRVGNLLFKELGFHLSFQQRDDIAVQSYFFRINKPYLIDLEEIAEIKNTLARHLKERMEVRYYEIGFDFDSEDNIVFSLYYWQETKELHFEIFNHREYPHLLLNEAYESKMQISYYQIFDDKDCCFSGNYRTDKNIKRRPPILTELFGEKLVLWVDRENGILGIADKNFAQLIPLNEIERFEIERILPAKGGGGDFFRIFKKGNKYPTELLRLPCYTFDKDDLLRKVEKVVGQEVKVTGGYYDC